MAYYENVVIEWHDTPDAPESVAVSIDEAWNGFDEEDDNIFFYFANESEFEQAKQDGDNGYEFRILGEDQNV